MRPMFGTNQIAEKQRVYYTETSDIYEGMPVCFEFDATANVLGYDKGAGGDVICQSTPNTTAEGNQNEGKFIRVEDPDADNINAFAGVVAGTSEAGKTGPRWLDIYVPNGAVVPVRTDQSCTVGRTVLAVHTGESHLTAPYATAGRSVAVAWETDTDLASTTGIVLAKLDPNMFLYQKGDGDYLLVDDQDTGNQLFANQIKIEFASLTGVCTALGVFAKSSVAQAASYDYGLALYVQADWDVLAGLNCVGSGHWINLNGGTAAGDSHITSLWAGVYEDGAALTAVGYLTSLTCSLQVADAVTGDGGNLGYIMFRNDGAQDINCLFCCEEASDILMTTGSAATQTQSIPIRVRGTTYWLMVSDAAVT